MQAAQHKLIYDVGAHKGEDTEFYLKKGFSVVAIEANPALCLGLTKRFEEFINSGRLEPCYFRSFGRGHLIH